MNHGKLGACVGVAFACQVGADLLGVTTTGIPWGTVAAAGLSVGASYLVNLANDFTKEQQKVAEWIQNEHIAKLIGCTIGQILEESHQEFKGAEKEFETKWESWSEFTLQDLKSLDTSLVAKHLTDANPAIADVRLDELEDWEHLVRWYAKSKEVKLSDDEIKVIAENLQKSFLRRLQKNMAFHDVAWKKLLPQMLGEGFGKVNLAYDEIRKLSDKFGPTFEPYEEGKRDDFFYRSELAAFRGREDQIRAVGAFLDNADVKLRWWRITGPAGSGKSRFGLNLLRLSEGLEWFSVRVKLNSGDYREQWKTWLPQHPTLLVIDYALDYAEEAAYIIRLLSEKADKFEHRVRILLLARESESVRWDRFFDLEQGIAKTLWTGAESPPVFDPTGMAGKAWTKPGSYLKLNKLEDHDLIAIAEDVHKEMRTSALVDRSETIRRLSAALPELRLRAGDSLPLLVQIAAQKASLGETDLTDPETLVLFLLKRETDRWSSAGLTLAHRNLAIASTMLDGISTDHPVLENCPHISVDLNESRLTALFSLTSGYQPGYRPKIEPDLIGELFVLKSLDSNAAALSMGQEDGPIQAKAVVEHILSEGKAEVDSFLIRAADSWPVLFKASNLFEALNPDQKATAWALEIELAGFQRMAGSQDLVAVNLSQISKVMKVAAKEVRMLFAMVCVNSLARPHLSSLVNQLLDELRKLCQSHPEDPDVRGELAKGLFNAFVDAKGDPRRQGELLNELQNLSQSHPDDPDVRGLLAKGLFNAFLDAKGDPGHHGELLDELRNLSQSNPDDPAVRGNLAKSIFNAFLDAKGDPGRQGELLDELRHLSQSHSDDPAVRGELAKGLVNAFVGAKGDPGRQGELLDELRKLSQIHPDDPDVRDALAKGLFNAFNGFEGDPAHQKLLLDELRKLSQDHPEDQAVHGQLGKGLVNALNGAKGDHEAQKLLLDDLRKLSESHPEDQDVHGLLASGLFNAFVAAEGDHEAQKLLLDELRELSQDHPEDQSVRDEFNKGLVVKANLSIDPEETILFFNEAIQNALQGTLERVPALIPFVQKILSRFTTPNEDEDSD